MKNDKVITNLNTKDNMNSVLKYLLVADNAIIDKYTGKLSVIGLFRSINLKKGKKGIISFVVAGELEVKDIPSDNSAVLTVIVKKPKGEVFSEKKIDGKLEKGTTLNFIVQFVETFEVPGEYSIDILFNDSRPEINQKLGFFEVKNI